MSRVVAAAALAVVASACTPRPALPPPRPPVPVPGETGLRWVQRAADRAREGGASAPVIVATGAGAPGDNLGGRVELAEDLCGLFLARGSASIQDLDLFVYTDDGAILGADETQEPGGSALVCPPHPRHVYAFGRVAAGHGMFTVSAQAVRPSDANRSARAAGVPTLSEQAIASGGWPGLDEALAARRLELGGAWRDVRRVAIPMDPRIPTRVSAPIGPEQCLDVLVLPAEEVAFAELTVLDSAGRIIGRAPNEGQRPAVVLCSAARDQVTLELQPHAGRGMAALVLSVTTDRKSLDPGATLALRDAGGERPLEQARADLARSLGAVHGASTVLSRGSAAIGRRESRDVDLAAGCTRFDVVAGAPLRGVEAWLWSAGGALLAHDDGSGLATLFACGPATKARIDVEAVTRAGPYALESRSTKLSPGLYGEHPLAASRLLGRLWAAARIPAPEAAGTPVRLDLSPTTLAHHSLEVAAGRCLDATIAVGPGAEGVELRLVDAARKDELTLVRGTYSAIATVCTLDRTGPTRIDVEARSASGSAAALLALPVRAAPPGAPSR